MNGYMIIYNLDCHTLVYVLTIGSCSYSRQRWSHTHLQVRVVSNSLTNQHGLVFIAWLKMFSNSSPCQSHTHLQSSEGIILIYSLVEVSYSSSLVEVSYSSSLVEVSYSSTVQRKHHTHVQVRYCLTFIYSQVELSYSSTSKK